MSTCFIRSFVFHKKFLMYSKTPSLKFFSSFSPIYNQISGSNCNSYQYKYKKLKYSKHTQFRNFSLNGLRTFYDALCNSGETIAVKNFLIQMHDVTGLPWWATIISAATALKIFISLPCGVCQHHIMSKLELTKIELNASMENIKSKLLLEAKKKKWTPEKVKSELNSEMRKQWKMLVVKNNCHPFKTFILFTTQFPVWLLMTLSIRNLTVDAASMSMKSPVSELQFLVGGPIWCPNLAMPDPTYILPVVNALAMLINTELNLLHAELKTGKKEQNFLSRLILPNFLRMLAVVFFLVSSVAPSAISLFWASSSLFALLQNVLLMTPRMRRLFRIPMNPNELNNPFIEMWTAFLRKWLKLFSRK